jgi:hypothetical protein
MSIPFVGFSNATLQSLPEARQGDSIRCPKCGERHRLRASTQESAALLLYYECGGDVYIGALHGRLVVGVPADASGNYDSAKEGENG